MEIQYKQKKSKSSIKVVDILKYIIYIVYGVYSNIILINPKLYFQEFTFICCLNIKNFCNVRVIFSV